MQNPKINKNISNSCKKKREKENLPFSLKRTIEQELDVSNSGADQTRHRVH